MEPTNNTSKQDESIGFWGATGVFAFGAIAILGILVASGVSFSDMFRMGGGAVMWLLLILAGIVSMAVIVTIKDKGASQREETASTSSKTYSILVGGGIIIFVIVLLTGLLSSYGSVVSFIPRFLGK